MLLTVSAWARWLKGLPFCDPLSFFCMLRRYREAGGLALGRPIPALISVRTANCLRATRWFSCESNPASASTIFRPGQRRLAARSSGRKSGASEPMPVRARAAKIRCVAVSTLRLSLGERLAERERLELAVFLQRDA